MPAAIPLIAGAAVAGGTAIANAAGVGKNTERAQTFGAAQGYDANQFQYGGQPGGADAAANRYRYGADHAQGRGAEQVNYGQANQYGGLGMQARQGEAALAQQMQARAMGQVPSIAQQQADRQMQQAVAAQASQAASARGAAGLALAGQTAASNTAMMQSGISNQAQMNAAQERQQAEGAAMGAYGQLRGGDMAGMQQAAAMAQYQAQLNAQQRAQNDQFSMGFTQAEQNVRAQQLQAGMGQQQFMAGNFNQAQAANLGIAQANAQNDAGMFRDAMGAITGGVSAAATPGGGKKGP